MFHGAFISGAGLLQQHVALSPRTTSFIPVRHGQSIRQISVRQRPLNACISAGRSDALHATRSPSGGNSANAAEAVNLYNPRSKVSTFRSRRLIVFLAMSATYATYVGLRSTFTFVAPQLSSRLLLSLSGVGLISSTFPFTYGLSRLLTGVIVDTHSARVVLCTGLFLAGLCNVLMASCGGTITLAVAWGLHGLVQGVGAGACAKLLTAWYGASERGTWWALWSTSANLGAFAAPILCARIAASTLGPRAGLLIPGALSCTLAAIAIAALEDSPQEAGIDELISGRDGFGRRERASSSKAAQGKNIGWKEAFINGVLKNPTVWALCGAYFCTYLARTGLKNWLHFYLLQSRNISAADAAYRASGMEVGGMLGTFSAGVISDHLGGRRVLTAIVYLCFLAFAIAFMPFVTGPASNAAKDVVAIALLGFLVNGPQMIIGLIGAEVCDRRVLATAAGLIGCISYGGAAAAGLPLSVIIAKWGWNAYFAILASSCVAAGTLLAPFWKLRGGAAAENSGSDAASMATSRRA